MPWITSFIASWIILIFLVDMKQLKYTIWSGVFAVLCQLVTDNLAIQLGLYEFKHTIIHIFQSGLIFTLGPPLTIGILFAQTYPKNNILRLMNVIVTGLLFAFLEYSLRYIGALEYIHWHFYNSILIDTFSLMSMGNFIAIFKLASWMRDKKLK